MLTSDLAFLGHAVDTLRTPEGKLIKALVKAHHELVVAVATSDEVAIKAASDAVTDLNLESVTRHDHWPQSPFDNDDTAAALLAELARELRARLVDVDDDQRSLAAEPESEWWCGLTLTRANLRILERDWQPLEALPKRKYLGAPDRRQVVRLQGVLSAFADRDAPKAKRLIVAMARETTGAAWLLAWALYREARKLGMPVSIRTFHSGELTSKAWLPRT